MSSTDIEVRGGSDLTIAPDQRGFTPQQVAALHQIGVENATDGDLAVFFHQAQKRGLDPFTRQIYMIGRRSKDPRTGEWVTKQTIQTGIDGFRLIARRAADARHEAMSIDDTLWADPNGKWHDVWIWPEPPQAAKTTVRIGGGSFSGVAILHDYCPMKNGSPTGQWSKMPAVMLAKCSEALALRKAFPEDLAGLYTGDEMDQANTSHSEAQQATAHHSTARVDWSPITEPMKALGMGKDQVLATASDLLGREVTTMSGLSQDEVDRIGMALVESKQTVDAEVVDEATGEVQDAFPDPAAPAAGADPWAEGGAA